MGDAGSRVDVECAPHSVCEDLPPSSGACKGGGPRDVGPGGRRRCVDQEKEQVMEPFGVLMFCDEFAVKPNVVLPSAGIVPL